MNDKQTQHVMNIINNLIEQYGTVRGFARAVDEDSSDVIKWRYGRIKIKARAVVNICRLHQDIPPYDLRPDWFPASLTFKWKKDK